MWSGCTTGIGCGSLGWSAWKDHDAWVEVIGMVMQVWAS